MEERDGGRGEHGEAEGEWMGGCCSRGGVRQPLQGLTLIRNDTHTPGKREQLQPEFHICIQTQRDVCVHKYKSDRCKLRKYIFAAVHHKTGESSNTQ